MVLQYCSKQVEHIHLQHGSCSNRNKPRLAVVGLVQVPCYDPLHH
jgi:hypothetical protein